MINHASEALLVSFKLSGGSNKKYNVTTRLPANTLFDALSKSASGAGVIVGTLDNIITNVKEGAGFIADKIVESYWSGMKGRNPISYNELRSKSM